MNACFSSIFLLLKSGNPEFLNWCFWKNKLPLFELFSVGVIKLNFCLLQATVSSKKPRKIKLERKPSLKVPRKCVICIIDQSPPAHPTRILKTNHVSIDEVLFFAFQKTDHPQVNRSELNKSVSFAKSILY